MSGWEPSAHWVRHQFGPRQIRKRLYLCTARGTEVGAGAEFADILEKGGHKVYTPTLTGLGERSHLMSGLISLDTHVIDVANVIKWEGLENIVLVGDPARSRVTRPTSTKAPVIERHQHRTGPYTRTRLGRQNKR